MYILMSVMMATMMFVMVPRAMVSSDRIAEVLDTETSVRESAPAARQLGSSVAPRPAEIEFRKAEFRYPGAEAPVLQDVSLAAVAGQVTAVIGSTGSGKSTLLNLVPRLFDVTKGGVAVDGVDVRDLVLQDLWSRIGLVPQTPFLFTGSVASNLRYGRPEATDSDLWHALEVAQARHFVEELPGRLESEISQGGRNLSGGQRQRLAIARALVRRPDIYLLDDSFSSLDFTTDAALRSALSVETRDAVMLIVAQRVATIRHADQIIVLDGGAVASRGTHVELMGTSPIYREIVLSQVSEAEAR